MVSDPRVSLCLSRLGGVYRDPAQVDRDASSLLKSSVGTHLQPLVAEMVENNGDTANVLVLQGTIAMHFRGNTYQLLVDIYLPTGYPLRPPVCYVRLAPNMYLKENHRHVGMDGKVYLPYLHEWNRQTHNLVELVVAMSSVFSADPPVFSRPAPPPGWTPTPPPATAASSRPYGASPTRPNHGRTPVTAESEREAVLMVEIAEANAAAEAARRAEQEEEQRRLRQLQAEKEAKEAEWKRQEALSAQRKYEELRLKQVKDQVESKLRSHLLSKAQECRQNLQTDTRDKQRLALAKEQKIDRQLTLYQNAKVLLEEKLQSVTERTHAIQVWLEDAAASQNKYGNDLEQQKRTIDERVQPVTALHAQMIDLAAENQAISDALYFLDRALYKGHLDCETHLRQVRKLAKRQFLLRAHLHKLNQASM